jgi:serine/threonine protein kinase
MDWLPNSVIDHLREAMDAPDLTGSPYVLGKELGRGGMGIVYEARDSRLGRAVALKVLSPLAASGDAVERMWREARILARLEHPGIVPIHDAGMLSDGRAYYAMKLVEGSRLDEYLRAGPSLPELCRIFLRICEPVAFSHARGIVHRDLKPENIMLGKFGEVLVLDCPSLKGSCRTRNRCLADSARGISPRRYTRFRWASYSVWGWGCCWHTALRRCRAQPCDAEISNSGLKW